MPTINFEERVKPGSLFLSTLGYKLDLPQVLTKWETIAILNAKNVKIGNAYVAKNDIEMMGEDHNFKFIAKYNLKKYQDEDKISANITHKYYNTTYRMQINLTIKSSLNGQEAIDVKMQVFSDNHQEFSLLISDYNHSLILDSFDEVRGKDHLEISNDEKQFTIRHQKENKDANGETIVFYENDERIYTISKVTFPNGEDIRRRYYPLTKKDNLISNLNYYLDEIDPIFKIPLRELNEISKGMFRNLIIFAFSKFKEEELVNLFGLNKKETELSRILEK